MKARSRLSDRRMQVGFEKEIGFDPMNNPGNTCH